MCPLQVFVPRAGLFYAQKKNPSFFFFLPFGALFRFNRKMFGSYLYSLLGTFRFIQDVSLPIVFLSAGHDF